MRGGRNVLEEDFQEFVVNRIIKLRMSKDVSAREMSLDIGQNKNYITEIENDRFLPSMTIFSYICDYFKITPHDFFDAGNKYPAHLNELINTLKELDESDLQMIGSIAKRMLKK